MITLHCLERPSQRRRGQVGGRWLPGSPIPHVDASPTVGAAGAPPGRNSRLPPPRGPLELRVNRRRAASSAVATPPPRLRVAVPGNVGPSTRARLFQKPIRQIPHPHLLTAASPRRRPLRPITSTAAGTWLSRGRTARLPWRSAGADGASATALQPPPHLLTTLPAPTGGGRRVRPATARRACRPPGPGRPRRPRRPSAGRRPEPPDAVGLGAVSRSRLNRRRPSSRWLRRRGTAGPPWPTRHASTCGAVTSSMPADGE